MNAAGVSRDDLNYQYYVAESVIDQFALSYTPTAIMRELVQNEYDADGQKLGIHFGSERLVITGNGNPIDRAGWDRLRVMLGTGFVPNSDTYVQPKESGLGSKNFGLRSLFTVGDEIIITSGGKWSALNCRRGAIHPPNGGARFAPARCSHRSAIPCSEDRSTRTIHSRKTKCLGRRNTRFANRRPH